MKNLFVALIGMLLLAACANNPSPTPSEQPVAIDSTSQALDSQFCVNHPRVCERLTNLCERRPVLCGVLCEEFPQLPFCNEAPQCLELGQPCLDEEEPGYVPCCGADVGTADCFYDPNASGYTCQEIPDAGGQCVTPGNECQPDGDPCCPSVNPNDPPYVCQPNDPEDPEAIFTCIPG